MPPRFDEVRLRTPPIPELVPPGVFDAFGWCESTSLLWRKPPGPLADGEPITSANPPTMAFVFRSASARAGTGTGMGREAASEWLPRELAYLHVRALCDDDEWVLAPWAIDDATDRLWERHATPGDELLLAADRLTALAWGLHDWAHFHNHGPFERRALTELQCDASALIWLALAENEVHLRLGSRWERVREEFVRLSEERFRDEPDQVPFDPSWLSAERLRSIARSLDP